MSSEGAGQDFRTVARVGEVPDGAGRPFEVDGRMIAVFRDGDAYFAADDECPHQGTTLWDGAVCDGSVTCRWHGWRFALADGSWVENPRIRVPTHPVRVVGDEIQVALSP